MRTNSWQLAGFPTRLRSAPVSQVCDVIGRWCPPRRASPPHAPNLTRSIVQTSSRLRALWPQSAPNREFGFRESTARCSATTALIIALFAAPALAQTPYDTLLAYRAQYPTPMTGPQAADLLNRVAWDYRAQGMRLLGKAGGENCPMPNGTLISCDFLVHGPTLTGFDVMSGAQGGAGSVSAFTWGPGPEPLAEAIASGARTLVDPIQPNGGATLPPPVGIPPPVVQPVNTVLPVALEIQRLANEIYRLQVEYAAADKVRAEALAAQLKEHDESPSWLGKLIKSPYFQIAATAFGTYLTTQQVLK